MGSNKGEWDARDALAPSNSASEVLLGPSLTGPLTGHLLLPKVLCLLVSEGNRRGQMLRQVCGMGRWGVPSERLVHATPHMGGA